MKGKRDDHSGNEKELKLLKDKLGIENISPDTLREALKQLADQKVISNYKIKNEKE